MEPVNAKDVTLFSLGVFRLGNESSNLYLHRININTHTGQERELLILSFLQQMRLARVTN